MKHPPDMLKKNSHHRKYMIAIKDEDHLIVKTSDIALIFIAKKIIYFVDKNSNVFTSNERLIRLESSLDPSIFFRINRQQIVSIMFIKKFNTYNRIRIQIHLAVDVPSETITSQTLTSHFRRWVSEI